MLNYLRTATIGGMLLIILAGCSGTTDPANEAPTAGGEATPYPAQSEPAAPAEEQTAYPAPAQEATVVSPPYPVTATP